MGAFKDYNVYSELAWIAHLLAGLAMVSPLWFFLMYWRLRHSPFRFTYFPYFFVTNVLRDLHGLRVPGAFTRAVSQFIMAIRAPLLLRGLVSPLQFIAAFAMVVTGIFDRVTLVSSTSLIAVPIWTGLLVSFVVYAHPTHVGGTLETPGFSKTAD